MSKRIWISHSIEQLEGEFQRGRGDRSTLARLAHELSFRKTKRAKRLAQEVEKALGVGSMASGQGALLPAPQPRRPPTKNDGEQDRGTSAVPGVSAPAANQGDGATFDGLPPLRWDQLDHEVDPRPEGAPDSPAVEFADRAVDVLDAWIAVEALSPLTYRHPRDLVFGDGGQGALVDPLPWTQSRKARPKTQLYFVAFLGAVHMGPATSALLERFVDKREDRQGADGFAALGAVLVDRHGVPLAEGAISVSSFGWSVGRVLAGRLDQLKRWGEAEKLLIRGLESILVTEDLEGERLPITTERLQAAHRWLVASVDLPGDLVEAPSVVTWLYHRFGKGDPASPILNSFYIADLLKARTEADALSPESALGRFLGVATSAGRHDLLTDQQALADALAPDRTPLARWPSPGRYPLVLLQQAAVNLAVGKGDCPSLISVNGPPGTGKTTLLRDVVASVVADRAERMAQFVDPNEAFTHAGTMKVGSGFLHLYEIDERLRGFEIVVASSNNKAVENISRELPRSDAIEADLPPPSYFRPMAEALLGDGECWGSIAAALGNAKNRHHYTNTVWWDEDVGLRNYLGWILGKKTQVAQEGEPGELGSFSDPRSVTEGDPPKDASVALRRWKTERERFLRVVKKAEAQRRQVQSAYDAALEHASLELQLVEARAALCVAEEEKERARELARSMSSAAEAAQAGKRSAEGRLAESQRARPGLLPRVFRTARAKEWKAAHGVAAAAASKADSMYQGAETARQEADERAVQAATSATRAGDRTNDILSARAAATAKLEGARDLTGDRILDGAFWLGSHEQRQTAPPNYSDAAHRSRDDVFSAAIRLHKAFVDAAAKPLRHNLGAFNSLITGKMSKPEHLRLAPSFWACAHLFTPVVSTTFASVAKLLGPLPNESLGWLLIDEAGQATPQSAIGAIMRSKRAIVVGDPLQLEPIVSLPPSLVRSISEASSVNPDRWMSPFTSAQSVADEVGEMGGEIQRDVGEAWVGVPLLVHRRCEEPMFSISNNLAYGGLMVQATPRKRSPVAELLGPSRWVDVKSSGQGKWSPAEGQVALDMLLTIAQAEPGSPSVFVITPFRLVAQQMRRLAESSGPLCSALDAPGEWIADHIGTIHTFQGKEAQGVVLLLGAPGEGDRGARAWATGQTNLFNVAVSRAKHALLVIGRFTAWSDMGCMRQISRLLPRA